MKKMYILMTISTSKYDGYYKEHFKVFDDYLDLQRHLLKFPYIDNNQFIVFEETKIKLDKKLYPINRIIRR